MLDDDDSLVILWCVNPAIENDGVGLRCDGFRAAIDELSDGSVAFMGELDVPSDNYTLLTSIVETALDDTGSWEGYGFRLTGEVNVAPTIDLLTDHTRVLIGTFDASDAIDETMHQHPLLSFAIDQQAYLQGYLPTPLLTQFSCSRQHLQTNSFKVVLISSQPRPPKTSVCEAKEQPTGEEDTTDNSNSNVSAIVGGVLGGRPILQAVVAVVPWMNITESEDTDAAASTYTNKATDASSESSQEEVEVEQKGKLANDPTSSSRSMV